MGARANIDSLVASLIKKMVEPWGIEPQTSAMPSQQKLKKWPKYVGFR